MDAFWNKVEKRADGCWIWRGATVGGRYGIWRVRNARRNVLAHRQVWEWTYGPIPEGLVVCHHCDVPQCVRPEHLFLGTQRDNIRDARNKGRMKDVETARGDEHWTRRHPTRVRSGAALSWTKLTDEDAVAIRARLLAGESSRLLADEFGVNATTIQRIHRRKVFKESANAV